MTLRKLFEVENTFGLTIESMLNSLEKKMITFHDRKSVIYSYDLVDCSLLGSYSGIAGFVSQTHVNRDGRVFICEKNNLFELDFHDFLPKLMLQSTMERVFILNDDYCVAYTASLFPLKRTNTLISIKKLDVLYFWESLASIVVSNPDWIILCEKKRIEKIDLSTKNMVWIFELEGEMMTPRQFIQTNNDVLITFERFQDELTTKSEYSIVGIDLHTGQLLFRSTGYTCSELQYSKAKDILYGLDKQEFICINPNTGGVENKRIVPLLFQKNLFGQKILLENKIYFSTSVQEVGCFNVQTEDLDFLIQLDMNEKPQEEKAILVTPIVSDDRMYIIDSRNVLTVYEMKN